MPERANYGIDAPTVVRNLLVGGGTLLVIVALIPGARPLVGAGLGMTFGGLLMLWASKVGKIRVAKRAVARLGLGGAEQVLDVGCGHGLMLITAAKQLSTGRAVGVDIWSQRDQASNRPEATLRNAELEGVRDRVEVHNGDARELPFGTASFDVVVSSLAIHNISNRAGRELAVREIARVLKPGGRVAIIDIVRTGEYARVLRALGFRDMRHGMPNFMWGAPMRLLTATRP
jgi:ubiquinone/menaquinone biosynthesis C-methylase UbiE